MFVCSRCEKCRDEAHGSGLCRSCYVVKQARDVLCVSCGNVRKNKARGMCRACYFLTQEYKDKKNAARRKKYAEDPGHRAELKKAKVADANAPARQRARNRRFFYRLEEDRFRRIMESQNGGCAICSCALTEGRDLHVDHCHNTGEVRGLLCGKCNSGIGMLRDRADLALKAHHYLLDRPATLIE